MDKSDRDKSVGRARTKLDFDNKSEDNVKTEDTKRTFLSKGSGLGGGKGAKSTENEEMQEDVVNSTPKFTPDRQDDDTYEATEERGSASNRSRRTRKARGPNAQASFDARENVALEKKSSLEEFEELEKNIDSRSSSEYQVITKKNGANEKPPKKGKQTPAPSDTSSKPDFNKSMNKTVNESGSERQRLAKEKQEFRKMKEKFESDKLLFEKQKRDFDKQKLEFEKHKDVEMKKINAEKQKLEKERKTLSRQSDKKKDDSEVIEKLYKEIDALKDEIRKKDNKVSF